MLGGYANKIGFVDLTAGKVEYKDAPEEWKRKYIGGRGLGVKYVFENGPQVDPLSLDPVVELFKTFAERTDIYIKNSNGGIRNLFSHQMRMLGGIHTAHG